MLIKGLVIKDDADIDYAIFYKSQVAVWQDNVIIDSGVLQSYTNDSVKINNSYVMRRLCDLRVL